jgi:hypothetical protein
VTNDMIRRREFQVPIQPSRARVETVRKRPKSWLVEGPFTAWTPSAPALRVENSPQRAGWKRWRWPRRAPARAASSAVLAACARGELSPSEASEIMALISTHLQTIEVVELYTKVTAVETRVTAMEKGQQP